VTTSPPPTGTGVATTVCERISLNPLSSAANCASPVGEVSSLANTENGTPAKMPHGCVARWFKSVRPPWAQARPRCSVAAFSTASTIKGLSRGCVTPLTVPRYPAPGQMVYPGVSETGYGKLST
jgi:hypothetical protein